MAGTPITKAKIVPSNTGTLVFISEELESRGTTEKSSVAISNNIGIIVINFNNQFGPGTLNGRTT